jgi:hypothetical protein
VTKTIIPADPGDLYCDTCSDRYPSRGDGSRTRDAARVRGWHIHQEPDGSFRILCPVCIGTSRSKIQAPPILQDQTDIFTQLGITIHPMIKRKGET